MGDTDISKKWDKVDTGLQDKEILREVVGEVQSLIDERR